MHLNVLLLMVIYMIFLIWYWKKKPLKRHYKIILVFPLILALIWELLITKFIMTPVTIGGTDMNPNFVMGQYYMAKKLYSLDDLKRSKVIVIESKDNPERWLIKRIIGLPNDKVRILNGSVYINDTELNESYLSPTIITRAGEAISEDQILFVPKNEYFVLGDNRENSKDSRLWGTFPRENIIGTLWFRYY